MEYIIGTRGSALALTQTNLVRDALAAKNPEHTFTVQIVKTAGDRVQDRPLREVGTSGIFTRELEQRLRSGEIDLAVHSMKDMPAEVSTELCLCSVLPRENPMDVLISREKLSLDALPEAAVVGTGSLRRIYQLKKLRPDLQTVDIRGNVDTRLRKMQEQHLDAIVLAGAGLNRLGLGNRATQFFSPEQMLPAPTQGILGAEFAAHRADLARMIAELTDPETDTACRCERRFLSIMAVGCHMPAAVYCRTENGQLRMSAMYGSEDGSELRFADVIDTDEDRLVQRLCARLRA